MGLLIECIYVPERLCNTSEAFVGYGHIPYHLERPTESLKAICKWHTSKYITLSRKKRFGRLRGIKWSWADHYTCYCFMKSSELLAALPVCHLLLHCGLPVGWGSGCKWADTVVPTLASPMRALMIFPGVEMLNTTTCEGESTPSTEPHEIHWRPVERYQEKILSTIWAGQAIPWLWQDHSLRSNENLLRCLLHSFFQSCTIHIIRLEPGLSTAIHCTFALPKTDDLGPLSSKPDQNSDIHGKAHYCLREKAHLDIILLAKSDSSLVHDFEAIKHYLAEAQLSMELCIAVFHRVTVKNTVHFGGLQEHLSVYLCGPECGCCVSCHERIACSFPDTFHLCKLHCHSLAK